MENPSVSPEVQPAEPSLISSPRLTPESSPTATPSASPQTPLEEKKPKKIKPSILAIIIICLILVGGVFAYQYFQIKIEENKKQLQTQANPETSLQQPSAVLDPSDEWEMYTNSIHDISFKYPSSWDINEQQGQKEGEQTFNTKIWLSKDKANITIYLNMDGIGGKGQTLEGEKFKLDGIDLYQYSKNNAYNNIQTIGLSNSLSNTLGVFIINDITYSITLNYPGSYSEDQTSIVKKEFNQILSSFRFTELDDKNVGWKLYSNPTTVYSFRYPPDLTLEEFGNTIYSSPTGKVDEVKSANVSKWGPSQQPNTEGYDGIFLSFTQIPKEQFSLEEIVDYRLDQIKEEQIVDVIIDKQLISINSYNGFTFSTQGLGINKYIYLADSGNLSDYYILVTDSTKDPGNLGFDETVTQIFSSFQFLN